MYIMYIMYITYMTLYYTRSIHNILMRDEKEERKKQARSNKHVRVYTCTCVPGEGFREGSLQRLLRGCGLARERGRGVRGREGGGRRCWFRGQLANKNIRACVVIRPVDLCRKHL